MDKPKKKSIFTDAELKAMRLADEEIEREFRLSPEDLERSRRMDKQAKLDRLDNKGKKIAAQKAAYREANREKWNAYQREYRRRKKLLAMQTEKEMPPPVGSEPETARRSVPTLLK